MTARHPSLRAWPRAVAFLAVLTLAFGGDQIAHVKGMYWTKALWQQAMAAPANTIGPFQVTSSSRPYSRTLDATDASGKPVVLHFRCQTSVGPGHVYIVCVLQKKTAATPRA